METVGVGETVYRRPDGAHAVPVRMLGARPAASATRATFMRLAARHWLGDMPWARAKAAEKLVGER